MSSSLNPISPPNFLFPSNSDYDSLSSSLDEDEELADYDDKDYLLVSSSLEFSESEVSELELSEIPSAANFFSLIFSAFSAF